MVQRWVMVLALLLFLANSVMALELTSVEGKLTVGDAKTPVAGVQVVAYPLDSLSLQGEPSYRSQQTLADGLFRLELPVGSYYFIAEGQKLYSFYGRNPVTVVEGGISGMNLSLVEKNPAPPPLQPRVSSGIIGQLTYHGQPLEGAVVTVFTDLTSQLKGMGLGMTAPTGPDGVFEAEMPPGTYYLVARKRNSGAFMGPLQAGDYFGYYAANPLLLREGELAKVTIAMVEVPEKVSRLADQLFGNTSIHGRVVDAAGQPVAGIRVLLYGDMMMLNRPLYVSQPTNAEGRYVLSFPQGGTYWLAARNQLGGPPAPGEMYGRFQGSRDSSVRVTTGQTLEDVQLVIEKMQ